MAGQDPPVRVLALADRPWTGDLVELVSRNDVDVVFCLGDLQPSWLERLDKVHLPKFGVRGNHDDQPYMDWFGIEDMHLRHVTLDRGPSICGFEGCVTYRRGSGKVGPSFTQREASKLIRKLPPADVLLCHCPPWGVNDDPDDIAHHGFKGLRDWVLEHRPRLLLHGHTYPQPGTITQWLGETRVMYVHGSRVIELPD